MSADLQPSKLQELQSTDRIGLAHIYKLHFFIATDSELHFYIARDSLFKSFLLFFVNGGR